MSKKNKPRSMTRIDKGRMFLKHCSEHPLDVLRLSKATILYGTEGVKARADESPSTVFWKKRMNLFPKCFL